MIEHSLLRRLSFVRHLYNLGVDQSHGPEPLASVALLTLHDASEMFLQIAAEHHDVGKNHIEFIDYWKLLEGKGINLSHREPMRRLNKARVGMKHQGLTLAKSQTDGFRSTVTNFLYDNSLAAFELEFDRVSLATLVQSDRVKSRLEQAEVAFTQYNFKVALTEAAVAFKLAINDYEASLREQHGGSGYTPRTSVFGLGLEAAFVESALGRKVHSESVGELAKAVKNMAQEFSESIMVIGYNLDFGAYTLFRTIAPVVHMWVRDEPVVEWTRNPPEDERLVRRCLNFVIDTAIRLEAQGHG